MTAPPVEGAGPDRRGSSQPACLCSAAVPSAELFDSTPPRCSHLEIRGFVIVLGPSV